MEQTLWGPEEDRAEALLKQAQERGDLLQALLCVEGADAASATKCRQQLERWSAQVRALIERGREAQDAIIQTLVRDAGLNGERDNYYASDNSHLSVVIERRRGLPILLSSIWILVAHGADIEAEGVGMPGHFIVRIDGTLRDPFSDGRALSKEQCVELVSRLTNGSLQWQDAFLEATPPAAIITRVLRNLVSANARQSDAGALYRAARLLGALSDAAPDLLLFARACEQIGTHKLAAELYERVITKYPQSREAKIAARRSINVQQMIQRLN